MRNKMLFLREIVYELEKYGSVLPQKVSASLSLIVITKEYECRLISQPPEISYIARKHFYYPT